MSSENVPVMMMATALVMLCMTWFVAEVIVPRIKRRRRDKERAIAHDAVEVFMADETNLLDEAKFKEILDLPQLPYRDEQRLRSARGRLLCENELALYVQTGVNDQNWLTILCLLKTLRQHTNDEHELYAELSSYVMSKLEHVLLTASTLHEYYLLTNWFFDVDVWCTVLDQTYHSTCYSLCRSVGIPVSDRKILDARYKAIGVFEEAPVFARFTDFNVNSFTGTGFLKHIEELVNGRRAWDLWEGKLALALCVEYPKFREQAGYLMQDLQTAVANKLPSLKDVR